MEGFDELTSSDVDRLVREEKFDVGSRDALELDMPAETPLHESTFRPRTAKSVKQYLENNEVSTVSVENVLGENVGLEYYDEIPSEMKRELNLFLKAAVESEDIPVQKVNGSKFDLDMEKGQIERLVDFTRFKFIDRCLSTLEGDSGEHSRADGIIEYNDQVSNNKWQEMYSEDFVTGDIYPYRQNDFAAFNLQVNDEIMAKTFLQYHLALNNLNKDADRYIIKACPEEIDISENAIDYARTIPY